MYIDPLKWIACLFGDGIGCGSRSSGTLGRFGGRWTAGLVSSTVHEVLKYRHIAPGMSIEEGNSCECVPVDDI